MPDYPDEGARNILQNRKLANQMITDSLLKAQATRIKHQAARIKHQADKHRSERTLIVGDMTYLKIQPYTHSSLSIHRSLKLHSKYYGPFRVIERIGKVAYKLLLPKTCHLHRIFM